MQPKMFDHVVDRSRLRKPIQIGIYQRSCPLERLIHIVGVFRLDVVGQEGASASTFPRSSKARDSTLLSVALSSSEQPTSDLS